MTSHRAVPAMHHKKTLIVEIAKESRSDCPQKLSETSGSLIRPFRQHLPTQIVMSKTATPWFKY
jgi:hypothetical protein